MIYAGIVAGGTGSRMGASLPKQFLEISEKPVLIHTISCFADKVDMICVACHKDYVDYTKNLINKYFDKPIEVIEGGTDRMESVKVVVNHFLAAGATGDDIILTHDGVRPFVPGIVIEESIENARKGHFSTVAVGATDTVCLSADGREIDRVLDRRQIFNIQTPQTFTIGKLAKMLENCPDTAEFTDLCGLALSMGCKVRIINGSPKNIKITVPADLGFAETIIKGDRTL